jgi:DNA-binding beta-propeller fold protein YncE
VSDSFGSAERGFFVLPATGRLVGVGGDGTVSAFDPQSGNVRQYAGPLPLPAGPAVDPDCDAWYFADQEVVRYALP